jgi:hypothetical protein
MSIARRAFGGAMLAYALSFGLVAVSSPGSSIPGFMCAYVTFVGPLVNTDFFAGRATNYLPFLISGCVNLAFLASIGIRWRNGNGRAFTILRTTTLLMIPFCWIVLYHGHLSPREGHLLWIASMVVALFSAPISKPFDRSRFTTITDVGR